MRLVLVLALAHVALLGGCATAVPALTGGSTTPHRRGDLALGGAARIPTGDLREDPTGDAYRRAVESGGVVPVAFGRAGVARHTDVGLMVAGTIVRAEVRQELGVVEDSTRPGYTLGLALEGGPIPEAIDGGGSGYLLGVDLPLAKTIDFGGLYEFWLGARLGADHVRGDFDDGTGARADAAVTSLRAGAFVGLGLGFRRVHTLVEVTAAFEQRLGSQGGRDLDRRGFVLIPAFALRLRI